MCTVVALETTYRAMSTNRYIANVLNFPEHAANVPLCHGSQQRLFKGELQFITTWFLFHGFVLYYIGNNDV